MTRSLRTNCLNIDVVIGRYQTILLLKQELFYEIQGHDSIDGRPIIRILPVFPVEMWHQIGHLMNRAVLLNIKIAFILEKNFFKSILEPDMELISQMALKIELEPDQNLKSIYTSLKADSYLYPSNIYAKLMKLCSKIERLRLPKNPRGFLSTRSFELPSTLFSSTLDQSPKILLRRHSIEDLSQLATTSQLVPAYELLRKGLKSFEKGLSSGMNVRDFTVEELYKIIFY